MKNIDPNKFIIKKRDNLTLVTANRTMTNAASWNLDELHYRSIIYDSHGNVVSRGFPKFFNYNERKEIDKELHQWIKQGKPITITEKIDGSLVIRSIINNEVILRTRGVFNAREHDTGDEVYGLLDKYPQLRDKNLLPQSSMLFEYITPNNQIIISHDEPDLIFLGIIDNVSGELSPVDFVESMAKRNGLNLVPQYNVPDIKATKELVDYLKSISASGELMEGFVIRFGQGLIKIKTEQYLRLHYIKYSLSYKQFAKESLQFKIYDKETLMSYWLSKYDFEVLQLCDEYIKTYLSGIKQGNTEIDKIKQYYNSIEAGDRKEFALYIQKDAPKEWIPILFLLKDDKDIKGRIYERSVL